MKLLLEKMVTNGWQSLHPFGWCLNACIANHTIQPQKQAKLVIIVWDVKRGLSVTSGHAKC